MSADNKRNFDIILWGATGFTGKLVIEYLAMNYGCGEKELKWAIAARNLQKLQEVQSALAEKIPSIKSLPLFTADSEDVESLKKLTCITKVIITTVGPYNLYGKKLLKACVDTETNYCDLTGEPNFIRYSIDHFHAEAERKKVQIVHSCGFDSIPSDMGTLFLQTKSLEIHGKACREVIFVSGESKGGFSGGTVASLLGVVEEALASEETRKILRDPYSLNPPGIRGEDGEDPIDIVYVPALKTWAAPFLMGPINTRVVRRSNAISNLKYGLDFKYQERMGFGDGMGGWVIAQLVRAGLGTVLALGAFSPSREFIKNNLLPAGEGPSEEERENGYFHISIIGFLDKPKDKADIEIKVSGKRDPGYGATSRMLSEAGIALSKRNTNPIYGVITPSTAFGLNFLESLKNAEVTFELK